MTCKLCLAEDCATIAGETSRTFLHCPRCGLIFVPRSDWLAVDDERARYALHDNTETNHGYRAFLGQVADVVADRIATPRKKETAKVLDFGSGPNAVLTQILRERGLSAQAYDPLYGLGSSALADRHDVIVLCEVIEHLRDLRQELLDLHRCLLPGGSIVIRTRCYPAPEQIPAWWYARDPTHINFFSPATLDFAAGLRGYRCEPTSAPDIFVWTGPRPSSTADR